MNRRLKIGIILILVSSAAVIAQQNQAYFSQYWVNGLAINPAYAGSREVFNVSMLYQRKWTGVEGSPTNYTFSAHTPLKNERIALGLFVVNQRYGIQKNTQAYLNYAFRLQTERGKISLGLKAGASFVNEDLGSLLSGLDDPTDPAFASVEQTYVQPNFGFGVYYYTPRYFVGVSIPDMMSYRLDTVSFKYKSSLSPSFYSYLVTAGVLIGKSEATVKWKPSFLMMYRSDYKAIRFDINSSFILFDDRLWIGASYRSGGSYPSPVLVGNIEVYISRQLMLGYSYDYTLGGLNNALNGVHEIILRYELGFKLKASNPRYF